MWLLLYHMRCDQYYIIWDGINFILNEIGSILYFWDVINIILYEMWPILYYMKCDQYYIIWDMINIILYEMW